MFAHACAYEKFFVPLCAFYGFMDELIRHEGIVLSTNDKMAHIQIVQSSACSACKAKAMCSSSESQSKEMDALMLEPMVPGDRVEVEVREHLAALGLHSLAEARGRADKLSSAPSRLPLSRSTISSSISLNPNCKNNFPSPQGRFEKISTNY